MAADPPAIIDAHIHLLMPSRFRYAWLPAGSPLRRDRTLPALIAAIAPLGVRGGVLIEADNSPAETEALLAQAAAPSWGVIGSADPDDPASADHLARWQQHPAFRGLRLNWSRLRTLSAGGQRLLDQLAAHGGLLEILVDTPAGDALPAWLDQQPHPVIILDHMAGALNPALSSDAAAACVTACAARPGTALKLSGFAGADPGRLRRLCQAVRAAGGRLLFGSDTPLHAPHSYADTLALAQHLLADWPEADRAAVLGGHARHLYRLEIA